MKITYFLRDNGACGYYRCTLPMQTVAKNNKDITIGKVEKGDRSDKIESHLLTSDIFMIPRPSEIQMLETIKLLKSEGRKIVIDLDDNLFEVSPLSPHYQEWGMKDVKYAHSGGMLDLWENGKNIDLQANKDRLDVLGLALEQADMITVTTDILADFYREFNDNVKVLPNCIDTDIWQKLPLQKKNEIRIGWQGGSSHYEDLCLLKDVLPEIIFKYPKVKLVFMGAMFKAIFKNIPKERYEFHEWVPTPAYPYKTAILDYDIGLIPLQNNEFNRCKSSIKWVEYSSLNIPTVTSYVSPYKEVMDDNNGHFIEENNPDNWVKAISELIESVQDRINIGINAENTVHENFIIQKQYPKWIEAYESLL